MPKVMQQASGRAGRRTQVSRAPTSRSGSSTRLSLIHWTRISLISSNKDGKAFCECFINRDRFWSGSKSDRSFKVWMCLDLRFLCLWAICEAWHPDPKVRNVWSEARLCACSLLFTLPLARWVITAEWWIYFQTGLRSPCSGFTVISR